MADADAAANKSVDKQQGDSKQAEEQKEDDKQMTIPFTKLSRNILNCLSSTKKSMDDFYVKKCGMAVIEQSKDKIIYGFNHNAKKTDVKLELRFNDTFKSTDVSSRDNAYWKIGFACPDVDVTRESLISNEIEVSKASQFRDIGYLCHLSDPSGFGIELLQHTFESNFNAKAIANIMDKEKYILGSNEVSIGQVTLRVTDIDKSIQFYEKTMGMQYLSRQKVDPYGFSIYFLGYPDDGQKLPNPDDIDAVENREWLWQRGYTTLELQHRWKNNVDKYKVAKEDETGWQGIVIESKLNVEETKKYLKKCDIVCQDKEKGVLKCNDPDGYPVFIACKV